MIITKVKLDPFGGFAGREVDFKPGLNVILGPNEAGKSTTFYAIEKGFLIPSRLHKRTFESEIENFVPIGGDTARVDLHFEHEGKPCVLRKSWGGTEAAELIAPDGSLITDDAAISEKLEELLPAKKATVQTVLMTYQSGLEYTLYDLEEETEAVRTLGDLLRKAVMESGGISVEGFRESVQAAREGYFSRWDRHACGPEGGRGINKPWKQGVGEVLGVFYEKEYSSQMLEQALSCEGELDRINGEIGELVTFIEEKDAFIRANEKVVEDARKRGTLEARRGELDLAVAHINEVNSSWPVLVSDIERIDWELPGLEARYAELETEKEQAQRAEDGRALREKFGRAKKKKLESEEARERLGETKRLTGDELAAIRTASDAVNIASASSSAGKLAAIFHASEATTLRVTKDMDSATDHEIDKDADLELDAGGRIRIEHADWSVEINSGEVDFTSVQTGYDDAKTALAALLEKHGVESLDEAIEANRVYDEIVGQLKAAGDNLADELDGDDYEDLESAAKELVEAGSTRPVAEVVEEFVNAARTKKEKVTERDDKQKTVDGFEKEYDSPIELMKKLARELSEADKLEGQLAELAPLPDGYESAEQFIDFFEESKKERDSAKGEKADLEVEKAELPKLDESSEELQTALEEATAKCEATMRKAEAVARIADLTEEIVGESGGEIYAELEHDLEHYVATITDDRYAEVAMEDGLPQGFQRKDGQVVLYDLMSHGTKDVLGLALRLSMANHFLKETDGFLAMDDPMVDLDPGRQEKAAEILKEYAADKQVLIFTCHPTHADLLGGNLIQM